MSPPLRWLFLDFDSYFASVEQQLNPALRGKPVAVVPVMADSTSCIAASYPAKAYGIKTGTRVAEARQLCPDITFVEADHRIYVEYHHRFHEIIESILPITKTLSIDEVSCSLATNWRDPQKVETLIHTLKAKLARYVSPYITCSIGAAPNAFLAKLASKYRKPNGGRILLPAETPSFLFEHHLRDLNGIGARMEERLRKNGIYRVEQLYAASEKTLLRIWGSHYGSRMWRALRCEDLPEIKTSRSSIGHGHVLSPEKRAPHHAVTVMHRLLQKAALRLRAMRYVTGTLQLQLRYEGGLRWAQEARFDETDLTHRLGEAASQLWERRPSPGEPLRKIQINFPKIKEFDNFTPSLLTTEDPRRRAVDGALDQIVARFGKHAAYYGNAHGATEAAPMRIAFNHIPCTILEE